MKTLSLIGTFAAVCSAAPQFAPEAFSGSAFPGYPGEYPGSIFSGYPGALPGSVFPGYPGGYPGSYLPGYPGRFPGGFPGGYPGGFSSGYPGDVPLANLNPNTLGSGNFANKNEVRSGQEGILAKVLKGAL